MILLCASFILGITVIIKVLEHITTIFETGPLSYVRMFVPYHIDKQSSEDAKDIVEGIYGRCQKGVLNVNIVLSFHRGITEMVINQQN